MAARKKRSSRKSKYLDDDGNLLDPRSKVEKFEQCVYSVMQGNQKTIVKYDPVRVCMRNIYQIALPMSEEEKMTHVQSLKAQEKYFDRVRRNIPDEQLPIEVPGRLEPIRITIPISEKQARQIFGR